MERIAPSEVLTPRLTIRALRDGDGAALHALVRRNRDRLADSFPKLVEQIIDPESGEQYIAGKMDEWSAGRGYWYGIRERASDQLLGQIQIKNLDREVGRAELAYWIDRDREGLGLVAEAIREIVRVSFDELGLHKVFLRTIMDNRRSETLAMRLGFAREGTLRGEFLTLDGRRVDLHYFGLLASERGRMPASGEKVRPGSSSTGG
jgi:ribosomal-protein-serine acetyltransferase